jgi:transcriptional regulator with XRE-family HTH domain
MKTAEEVKHMVTASTVRIVRAYLNWTQSELAERMGVSCGSVSAVENGTNRITPEFAMKFKHAVGITDAVLIDIQYLQTMISE